MWEVSWRLNRTATYWHLLFWQSPPFFPILLGCSTGGRDDMVLIPASSLQLIRTSCRRGYMIIWHPPTSCELHNFALNSSPRQSRSTLISSTGCTCYFHRRISSFDSLAGSGVNMQQLIRKVLLPSWDAVGVFYRPSRLGCYFCFINHFHSNLYEQFLPKSDVYILLGCRHYKLR